MNSKKMLALILALVLALSLCACGGGGGGSDPDDGAVVDGDAAVSDFELDYTSSEWQDMSDDRTPLEDLRTVYAAMQASSSNMTYADVVALVGCDASEFRMEGESRVYRWNAEESEYEYIGAVLKDTDGEWYVSGYSRSFYD